MYDEAMTAPTARVQRAIQRYRKVYSRVHRPFLAKLCSRKCIVDQEGLCMGGKYVMYFSERGLMRRHAELLLSRSCDSDILEVGYGLGIFAQETVGLGVKSHTIVEVHPVLAERARQWQAGLPHLERVRIIHSSWQDSLPGLAQYDAIMYDAGSPPRYGDYDFRFFVEVVCGLKLKPRGRFSFWSYGKTLASSRERLLHAHFRSVETHDFRMESVPASWGREGSDFTIVVAK